MLAAWMTWIVTCVVAPLFAWLMNQGVFEPMTDLNVRARLMERVGIGAGLPILAAVWVLWRWSEIRERRYAIGALVLLIVGTGIPVLTVREAYRDLRAGPVVETVKVESITSASVSRYGTFTTMYALRLPGGKQVLARPALDIPDNRPVELSYLPHQRILLRADKERLKPAIPGLRTFSTAAVVLLLGYALWLGSRQPAQGADASTESSEAAAGHGPRLLGALVLAVLFALIALP